MKRILVLVSVLLLSLSSLTGAAAEKEWTFLLFLNGNNNLDSFGTLNLNQMEKVGSSDSVNLVAQWASLRAGTVKRVYLQKDNDANRVTSPVIQDMGEVDMGDHRNLEEFIKWGVTAYPAKHYFVAVWDHGSGWRNLLLRSGGFHISDISWDDNTNNSITTKQLGQVMNNVATWMGRKIDVYGSDACLMGMVEIAAEMGNAVNYFVGSQDLEPGAGWPYDKFLAPLIANPAMSGRELSAVLTEEYTKSYQGGSNGRADVTMSAVDMGQYEALRNAIDKLGSEVRRLDNANRAKIFRAANDAQAFDYSDYVDLGDFLNKVTSQNLRELDVTLVQEAQNALKNFVVLTRNSGQFLPATGVSIWIPKDTGTLNRHLSKYKSLAFEGETRWSEALAAFVGK